MKQQSAWMNHLQEVYKNGKQQNGEFKFKDAMKQAKQSYQKQQGGK